MYESFGELILRGFDTWKRNLNICVPFILGPLSLLVLAAILWLPLMAVLLYLPGSGLDLDLGQSGGSSSVPGGAPPGAPGGIYLFIIPAVIVLVLVAVVISSFFQSGAIAMAREATVVGKTSTDVMWASGRRHYIKMAKAYILMLLVWAAAAALVYLPAAILSSVVPGLTGLIMGVAFMLGFVLLLLTFLSLALAPYALVVDDLSPKDAINASIGFFRAHRFDVLPIPILLFAISLNLGALGWIFSLTGSHLVSAAWSLANLSINLVMIKPLGAVWWTRLYIDRTRKQGVDEVR